jgi:hypothetical protein
MCHGVVQLLGWCVRDRPQGFSFMHGYSFTRHLLTAATSREVGPQIEIIRPVASSVTSLMFPQVARVFGRTIQIANNIKTKHVYS